jgi:hypothetical protein
VFGKGAYVCLTRHCRLGNISFFPRRFSQLCRQPLQYLLLQYLHIPNDTPKEWVPADPLVRRVDESVSRSFQVSPDRSWPTSDKPSRFLSLTSSRVDDFDPVTWGLCSLRSATIRLNCALFSFLLPQASQLRGDACCTSSSDCGRLSLIPRWRQTSAIATPY